MELHCNVPDVALPTRCRPLQHTYPCTCQVYDEELMKGIGAIVLSGAIADVKAYLIYITYQQHKLNIHPDILLGEQHAVEQQ